MVEAISRAETLGRGRRRRAGRFVGHLLAFLLPVFLPIAAGAQTPEAPESERTRAARVLLDDGVEGLAAVLGEAGAPPFTFDQEAQVRLLHETYDRQRVSLLEEGTVNPDSAEAELAEQLLLAAAKFLNPVQRNALGGFVEAEINRDLPQDEAELREYLRDLTNPTSGRGGFVIDGFSGGRMPNRNEIREIRINDNSFTAEQSFQGRGRTEIITRGGAGQFNGDFTFGFADESLDARNAFADFRPPYQTREFELNLSAPILRNRLTLTGSFSSEVDEEGDTLRAITPSGLISDAVVKPEIDAGSLDAAGGGGYFGRRSGMRMTIEARAENVLNRMNVGRLSGVISSPFFGLPIRARDAREISLEMRFDF